MNCFLASPHIYPQMIVGPETPIAELVEFICAAQMAKEPDCNFEELSLYSHKKVQ